MGNNSGGQRGVGVEESRGQPSRGSEWDRQESSALAASERTGLMQQYEQVEGLQARNSRESGPLDSSGTSHDMKEPDVGDVDNDSKDDGESTSSSLFDAPDSAMTAAAVLSRIEQQLVKNRLAIEDAHEVYHAAEDPLVDPSCVSCLGYSITSPFTGGKVRLPMPTRKSASRSRRDRQRAKERALMESNRRLWEALQVLDDMRKKLNSLSSELTATRTGMSQVNAVRSELAQARQEKQQLVMTVASMQERLLKAMMDKTKRESAMEEINWQLKDEKEERKRAEQLALDLRQALAQASSRSASEVELYEKELRRSRELEGTVKELQGQLDGLRGLMGEKEKETRSSLEKLSRDLSDRMQNDGRSRDVLVGQLQASKLKLEEDNRRIAAERDAVARQLQAERAARLAAEASLAEAKQLPTIVLDTVVADTPYTDDGPVTEIKATLTETVNSLSPKDSRSAPAVSAGPDADVAVKVDDADALLFRDKSDVPPTVAAVHIKPPSSGSGSGSSPARSVDRKQAARPMAPSATSIAESIAAGVQLRPVLQDKKLSAVEVGVSEDAAYGIMGKTPYPHWSRSMPGYYGTEEEAEEIVADPDDDRCMAFRKVRDEHYRQQTARFAKAVDYRPIDLAKFIAEQRAKASS